MSILIDRLVDEKYTDCSAEYLPGQWFVAKPYTYKRPLWYRIREAWRVLVGSSVFTYHYKCDSKSLNME